MRGRATIAVAVTLVAVSVAAAAISGALFHAPGSPGSRAGGPANPIGREQAIQPAPGRPQLAELERLIRAFTDQTSVTPTETGLAFLGRLELERARLTGDVDGYTRATRALTRAYRIAPNDAEVGTTLAGARFTIHDFVGALQLADAIYAATGRPGALVVRGDAELELGRYDAATADYRQLAALVPGTSGTQVRQARLAFLTGHLDEAERLALAAESDARQEGAFGATLAWYAAFRGRLALDAGRYDEAARRYARAVRLAPDYHLAVAGLAQATAAQGHLGDAIALYRRAIRLVPEPTYMAALGDLEMLAGDTDRATTHYGTVEAIATLARSRGLYDRQLAVFFADHDTRLADALGIMETSITTRGDVYGYDALGWTLYRLNRLADARTASDRALALGTPDARLWFHAGMISAALGDDARARAELSRALAISPNFDLLLAPVARDTLAGLEGGS